MIGSLIKKIVGSKNERELKRIQPSHLAHQRIGIADSAAER